MAAIWRSSFDTCHPVVALQTVILEGALRLRYSSLKFSLFRSLQLWHLGCLLTKVRRNL